MKDPTQCNKYPHDPGLSHCRQTLYHLSHQGSSATKAQRTQINRKSGLNAAVLSNVLWLVAKGQWETVMGRVSDDSLGLLHDHTHQTYLTFNVFSAYKLVRNMLPPALLVVPLDKVWGYGSELLKYVLEQVVLISLTRPHFPLLLRA